MPDKTSDDINNQVGVQIPSKNDGTLDTNQSSTSDFQDNPSNLTLRRSNRNVYKPVKFSDYELRMTNYIQFTLYVYAPCV